MEEGGGIGRGRLEGRGRVEGGEGRKEREGRWVERE